LDRARFERRIAHGPPIDVAMEGSMKMMSRSRYHCLSKSLLRAGRRYRAEKLLKIRQRSRAPRPPARGAGWTPGRDYLLAGFAAVRSGSILRRWLSAHPI
jgi:hypothetical protein